MNRTLQHALLAAALAAAITSCGVKYGDPIGAGPARDGGPEAIAPEAGAGDRDGGAGGVAVPLPGTLPEFCTADGWCGANLTFSGVWGSGARDVWVVANGIGDNPAASAVLRWDGSRWTTVLGLSTSYYAADMSDLDAVWGTSPSDVWVAGSFGTLVHWNGAGWTSSYLAGKVLRALWGSGANDVWAVGDAGVLEHWDGAAWTASPTVTGANLSGVWGSGARDVWAVGDAGTILHWNGTAWSAYQDAVGGTATTANLRAVWGSGAGDVWAVGDGGVVLRSDGAHWRISADGVPTHEDLKTVWGTGPSDVWTAGTKGTLLHFAGEAWYTTPAKTEETLLSVWGSGGGELWAVGDRAAALYWDRTAWQATAPRPFRTDLYAVSAVSADNVWVAGAAGLIAHFDGSGWRQTSTGDGDVRAVFVDAKGYGIWFVGDRGKILECSTFESLPMCSSFGAAGDPDWKSVWGSSSSDVWFGGGGGAIRHWNGSSFAPSATGVSADVVSMWGSGPADVWAATASDVVLHWDGQAWSPRVIPGGGNSGTRWGVVSGTSPRDVWLTGNTYFIAYKAGGARTVTSHFDGSDWSAPVTAGWPTDPTFTTGAWPSGTGALWATGPGPYQELLPVTTTAIDSRPLMRWDASAADGAWTRSLTGARVQLYGVSGLADGQMWIVGAGGTILHRGARAP